MTGLPVPIFTKKNLESYVRKEGMQMKTKVSIVATVTLLMAIGFICIKKCAHRTDCFIRCVGMSCDLLFFAL